jgi:hypothetical protein
MFRMSDTGKWQLVWPHDSAHKISTKRCLSEAIRKPNSKETEDAYRSSPAPSAEFRVWGLGCR